MRSPAKTRGRGALPHLGGKNPERIARSLAMSTPAGPGRSVVLRRVLGQGTPPASGPPAASITAGWGSKGRLRGQAL